MISFSLLFSNEKYIFLYDNRYFLHIPLFFKKRNGYRLNWTRNLSKNSKTCEKLGVMCNNEVRASIPDSIIELDVSSREILSENLSSETLMKM